MSLTSPTLLLGPVESGRDLSWPQIRQNFSKFSAVEMVQGWLEEKEPGFRPAWVRAGSCGEVLAILAELADDDIYNSSVSLNEKTWELGDVFEIFLKSEKLDEYYEFHVTPENQKLQLRIPSVASFQARLPWGTHCLEGDLFYSKTEVKEGHWSVYAEIPLKYISGPPWRYSFCRYDATRGKGNPVISSTSRHSARNFHCSEEWGMMGKTLK